MSEQPIDFTDPAFEELPPSSWLPIDPGPYLDGTHVPPKPGVLYRTDGVGLFYQRRVHWCHGESESGKSWVAQIASVDVLAAGGTVLYLDFESTPDEVFSRLVLLGAAPEDIAARFSYVQPRVSSDVDPQSFSMLLSGSFDLAVLDGVTEALGLYGSSSNDADEVTRWGRKLPHKIASETGAAVVCIDHVTKSEDGRGRFAFGSQAKLSLLDGCAYTVEPKEIAPGQCGALILRVGKDRAGQVRKNSGTYRATDRTQETARIRFDSTDPRKITYSVEPFASFVDPETGESTFRPTYLMERVSAFIAQNPDLSKKDITTQVSGNKQSLGTALDLLAAEGYVVTTDYIARGKPGKRYKHERPYREFEDQKSDKFRGSSEGRHWVPGLKDQGTQEPSGVQQPLTGFRNPVRNLGEPSSDLGKHLEPSEGEGSSHQDQEPSRNPVEVPRSTSDQQKRHLKAIGGDPRGGAGDVSEGSAAPICRFCDEPIREPRHAVATDPTLHLECQPF